MQDFETLTITVSLSDAQESYAERVGTQRQKAYEQLGIEMDPSKSMSGGLRGNILGFKCEVAVAKALGLRPEANVMDRAAFARRGETYDLGGSIEVRGTELVGGRLIVKASDKDTAPFVLVVRDAKHNPVQYTLKGWMYGRDAKRDQYLSKTSQGQEMYFIPAVKLRPISELKSLITRSEIHL